MSLLLLRLIFCLAPINQSIRLGRPLFASLLGCLLLGKAKAASPASMITALMCVMKAAVAAYLPGNHQQRAWLPYHAMGQAC
jgi:hypothetical protein